jgi:hypothetical protein
MAGFHIGRHKISQPAGLAARRILHTYLAFRKFRRPLLNPSSAALSASASVKPAAHRAYHAG